MSTALFAKAGSIAQVTQKKRKDSRRSSMDSLPVSKDDEKVQRNNRGRMPPRTPLNQNQNQR
jgi:hypothetical protein